MNSRKFARQMDAVETIIVDMKTPAKYSNQPFDYLLVLDFEATCWEPNDRKRGYSEIIEFPVVLYDIKNNEIVEEFQQYVMPMEKPKLSQFCTTLTGIQQCQVDNGVPLGTCLMLFTKWINDITQKYNISFPNGITKGRQCVFATWSDWDLKICLKKECKRKRIIRHEMFCNWIDIRALYMEHYLRRPKGLNGALSECGLKFEGREHCGLHDARNTSKLIGRMVADGMLLRITKTIF